MTDAATHAVMWRRLDRPGHDSAQLRRGRAHGQAIWLLSGTAVFAHQRRPCRLDYRVVCDAAWRTRSGSVSGWVGGRVIEIALEVDAAGRWRLNGARCPAVSGAIDLDLNFSPSTNLLPIRRLALAVGERAPVRAAWLHFPRFTLEPLDQVYRRMGASTYRYESSGGRFVTTLRVDRAGFVMRYPKLANLEATAHAP
jgi:hypothetical protein